MPFVVDMFAVEVFWRMPPSLGFEGAKARTAIELLREDSRVRDEGIIMADGLEKVRGRSEREGRERRESGREGGGRARRESERKCFSFSIVFFSTESAENRRKGTFEWVPRRPGLARAPPTLHPPRPAPPPPPLRSPAEGEGAAAEEEGEEEEGLAADSVPEEEEDSALLPPLKRSLRPSASSCGRVTERGAMLL